MRFQHRPTLEVQVFGVAILRFGRRSTLAGVNDESIESGNSKNPGKAVGTACLYVVEHEI
jgi:hypothetical protein